jgi:hypothetical protein
VQADGGAVTAVETRTKSLKRWSSKCAHLAATASRQPAEIGRKVLKVIDISKLSKVQVLVALYNAAQPLGTGLLHYDAAPMSEEEAVHLLEQSTYFDYVKGRVMKVDLSKNEFDPRLYDRDNGQGEAQRVISELTQHAADELVRWLEEVSDTIVRR